MSLPSNILKLSGKESTTYIETKVMTHMSKCASALSCSFVKDWLEDTREQLCYLKFRNSKKKELLSFVLLVKEKGSCFKQFSFACCRNIDHQDFYDLVEKHEEPIGYKVCIDKNVSETAEKMFHYFKKYQLSHKYS